MTVKMKQETIIDSLISVCGALMIKLLKKILKAVLVCVLLVVCFFTYISTSIWTFGNVDEARKVDAAIILGAAAYGNEPSPVFRERINHGIWLYEHGYVDKLIFTGGKIQNQEISDAQVAKDYAVSHSVPEEDILIEEESTITQENIHFAAQIAKAQEFSSVIIVSDPLHMKRAMLMAKDAGLVAYSSPTPTTMYRSRSSRLHFLEREVFYYIGYVVFRILD
jgi:uncharacterized SAM-binding protein YcdF (DUF218 family)